MDDEFFLYIKCFVGEMHGGHMHAPLLHNRALKAQEYPAKLCRVIVDAFREQLRHDSLDPVDSPCDSLEPRLGPDHPSSDGPDPVALRSPIAQPQSGQPDYGAIFLA